MKKKKSVRFNNRIVYHTIPNNLQEDRVGHWTRDAQWFQTRILKFEHLFKQIVIIK